MEQAQAVSPAHASADTQRSRQRALVEVAVGYVLIMAVIWTPRPLQRFLWIAAVAGVAFILWRSFDGRQAVGLRSANFLKSLWIVGAALLLAAAGIVVAIRLHTLYLLPGGPLAFLYGYFAYAIWSGVQQFLLQGFFLLRIQRIVPNAVPASLVTALLFAAAHLPNPILTPFTLLWGFVACMLFLRYRNLYPLMIAHAILGITVAITIPGPVDHNMRVGLGYLTYRQHMHRHGHWPRSQTQP